MPLIAEDDQVTETTPIDVAGFYQLKMSTKNAATTDAFMGPLGIYIERSRMSLGSSARLGLDAGTGGAQLLRSKEIEERAQASRTMAVQRSDHGVSQPFPDQDLGAGRRIMRSALSRRRAKRQDRTDDDGLMRKRGEEPGRRRRKDHGAADPEPQPEMVQSVEKEVDPVRHEDR